MQLEFIKKGEEKKIYNDVDEIRAIFKRIVTTKIGADCFFAGIAIEADGGFYTLIEE